MNFADTLKHNWIVAYERQDGTFSFWRLNKEAMKKSGDGLMRCESITDNKQGFPVKDLKKIYPIIGGVRGEEFFGYEAGGVLKVAFNTFVFPGKNAGNQETEVVVSVMGTPRPRQLQFSYSHFVQHFTAKDFERCQI